jgi:RNA polymerase sigma factor (sigma-70 family)
MRDPLANPEPLVRRVYAYVAYRVGAGPDAEDITSATFERALRYRSSFDPHRGDSTAWLLGIARRCVAEAASRPSDVPAQLHESAGPDHAESIAVRLELGAAVAHLPERQQELIALRFGGDLTARQIGELLEMKANAVEVALHRALASLRAILENESDDAEEIGAGN